MMWAPNRRSRGPNLITKTHAANRVPSRALDWSDIKSETIAGLESTTNVELGIATTEMAGNAGPLVGLADLADFPVPVSWDQPKALCWLEFFGVAELDFRRPDCAHNMHPVVAHSPLQRLPRTDWFPGAFLPQTIELNSLSNHLPLKPLLLPVSF